MNPDWSAAEDAKLTSLRSNGKKFKEIAREINRTPSAISNRAILLGFVRFNRVARKPEPREVLTQTVPKDELPAYYEAGWRVSWFEGNQVGIVRNG